MEGKRWFDEHRELPSPWEWIIIILFSASIVCFGLLVYYLVDDGPRHWDVGQLPDTPAESVYSTEEPKEVGAPRRQLPRLPEVRPGGAPKPANEPLRERGPLR